MKKIRINELARELEVKPGLILDLVIEFGVTEKKTHSSSIDEDVAEAIRRRLTGKESAPVSAAAPETAPLAPPPSPEEKVSPLVIETLKAAELPAKEEARAALPESAGKPEAPSAALPHAPVRPVRPPLTGGVRPPLAAHAPAIPIPPRSTAATHHPAPSPVPQPQAPVVSHPAPALPPRPAVPAAPPVAKPAIPEKPASLPSAPVARPPRPSPSAPVVQAAPPASPARSMPIVPRPPAAPAAPKPGSILGPRQSLPAGMGELGRPAVAAPGVPRPPVSPRPSTTHMQPASRPMAGQPAARPVVPPRPDLVAKLAQTQARAVPGQPTAPRPTQPRPGGPVPGQPIFRGPLQPGGRPMRGPGMPGAPTGPGMRRPGQGRGLHPTAPVVEPPPPGTVERRPADKRGRAAQREREIEEGKLKSPYRRASEAAQLPVIDKAITVSEGITVKEFSEKLGVKASLVIRQLLDRKIFATINQTMDVKLVEEMAKAFGATTQKATYEEESVQEIDLTEVEGDKERRPPVVTVMGHVDHGKTSLLDAIRDANVAGKEAGGITQHIGAYHIETDGRIVVFIDTPGHEAFTRMRARGAKVTDIVVLVVAADDGIMPQTREAIDHARAAGVPIVVAINKIDKPDAQPERVKQQLTEQGLMPEDWGGDTVTVPVSAKKHQNLDLLLENILLVADVQDLKANRTRPAVATVLEAKLDRGRGPVATLLVRNGTLRVGDHYLCGTVFGRVRAMYNDRSEPIKEAGPSMPVEVQGFESVPEVGDTLQVVTDVEKAKQIVHYRETKARDVAMAKTRITLEQLHAQLREGEQKELNLIIKADVGGTAEVLSDSLQKLSNDKVSIRVIATGVGAITESDVLLASASEAIIIGFNVRPERNASALADQEGVDIRLHTIIYELTDELKKAMVGMLDPVFKELFKGRAEVRETFRISKVGTVAGCYVSEGVITRDSQVRLLRDHVVVHTGKVDALKRFKNDASEVKSGFECGVSLVGYNDIKPGDIIEAFVMERVNQEALA